MAHYPATFLVSRAGSFITKDGEKEKIYHIKTQPNYTGFSRSIRTYRNKINTAIWPGSFFNMTVIMGGVVVVRVSHMTLLSLFRGIIVQVENVLPFSNETARMICGTTLCGLAVFSVITYCRRLILRQLFGYVGWLYNPPGKKASRTMKTWAILIKMCSGWNPSLYSYQTCLPSLPVPLLDETISKLLISLEPVYVSHPKKLAELKAEAKRFQKGVGVKLQRALVLRSFWSGNYVSDWWESYVYLMNRSPLAINSNYYIMDQCYWTPTLRQCARAAGTMYQLLLVREQILTEDLDPLLINKMIPVCMNQYKRIFSTTRVPGEEIDRLVHYPASQSQHVVVSRLGLLYKMDIMDANGHLISPGNLESQLEWIKQDADTRTATDSERLVPVLTSMDRTSWAKARQEYFSSGVNKDTLHYIESAILFVILDTQSFVDLSSRGAHLLHGDVGVYWFDKSIQLIAMSDGHIGLNCEHSYADAPAVAHVFEHNLTFEILSELYDTDGHCSSPYNTAEVSNPSRLGWKVDKKLKALISTACGHAEKSINDLDLVVYDYTDFGKGAIKQCKLSPDAFLQMSLNATYRQLTGTPVLTYEASMTRLFKHGRTETVRSLTPEANRFVIAFLDPKRSHEEKKSLLKAACEKHVILYKDAMTGRGIDRHLFALYVVSRGMGIDCKFLKKVLSLPWILSTSQQPQQQISWAPSCQDPKYQNLLSPGGGFGPVSHDGYGVSYMIPGDLRFFFHVSSRHSGRGTNSSKFMETLKVTMTEMINLHARSL